MKLKVGQKVLVTTRHGVVVDGVVSETGNMGGTMPFYPDSTVNKYGSGTMGRTAWGYRVTYPLLDPDTLEPRTDRYGRVITGLGYVEACNLEIA